MSYIDYVYVFNTFLASNNKNISKVKKNARQEIMQPSCQKYEEQFLHMSIS